MLNKSGRKIEEAAQVATSFFRMHAVPKGYLSQGEIALARTSHSAFVYRCHHVDAFVVVSQIKTSRLQFILIYYILFAGEVSRIRRGFNSTTFNPPVRDR